MYEHNTQGLLTKQQTGPAVTTGSVTALGSVVLKREYDYSTTPSIFGALLEESDGINSPIRYFYDSSNGRLLATLQNSEGVTYTYDARGRMTSVKPATGTSSSYSAVNNAETVNYTYNSAGELTQITTESTTYSFVYDSYGNTDEIKDRKCSNSRIRVLLQQRKAKKGYIF